MADQEPSAGGNGADDNAQPQVTILAQYVKDLSVENPSAPQVFSWQVQPSLDVQFNLNAESAGENVHEVTLKFDISARSDNGVHFVVDLTYAGLFGIRNVPEEALPPFLLIEAPRLLFPFARQVDFRCRIEHRLPAADARPDRFRRRLYGAARSGPAAGRSERRQRAGRRPKPDALKPARAP